MSVDTRAALKADREVYANVKATLQIAVWSLNEVDATLHTAIKLSNQAIVFEPRTLVEIDEAIRTLGSARTILEQVIGVITHHPVLTTKMEG